MAETIPTIEMPARVKDITGRRFGRLVVLGYYGPHHDKGHLWLCQCDCGNKSAHESRQMARGRTQSCGCFRREETAKRFSKGYTTPMRRGFAPAISRKEYRLEHSSYSAMIQRCHNPLHKDYRFYGAKGRSVCDRWRIGDGTRNGFECFVEDMPRRPSVSLTLDRIDNNGNYEPGNCRWATKAQQTANR